MSERLLNIAVVIELAVIIVLFFVSEVNGDKDNSENNDNNEVNENNNSYKNYKNYIEWNN